MANNIHLFHDIFLDQQIFNEHSVNVRHPSDKSDYSEFPIFPNDASLMAQRLPYQR